MAETFNPIISHLYSGQGGVSREITKYDNTTISEINFKESGVTTKYDFGGLFNEKMFTGNRVWNQLVQSFFGTKTVNDVTITNNTTYLTINGTASDTVDTGFAQINGFIGGHKYAFITDMEGMSGNLQSGYQLYCYSAEVGTPIFNTIHQANGSGNVWLYLKCQSGVTISNKNAHIRIHDLTSIYGAGNEPTTVAEFVHDYPEVYYPYNAGTNFSLATKLFNTIKQPLDSIKFYGNTMRWCQLVQNGNFVDESGWLFNASNHSVANNVLSLIATAQYGNAVKTNVSFINGHKYLILFLHKGTTGSFSIYTNTSVYFDTGINNVSDSSFTLRGGIITYDKATTSTRVNFQDNRASDWTEQQFKNVMLFDLTYIFGAGNEPTTVSDFTRRLKKLYYPFTNGEILSIEKASEYLYGLNIWDEEWEEGSINNSGQFAPTATIRSKNYTKVIPNTVYYITNKNFRICYYDEDKVFISRTIDEVDNVFTTPENCEFIKITGNVIYGTTYNHDICINLSDSSINGTYEASKGEQKMQLDSFNVWDEEWENGYISGTGAEVSNDSSIRSKNYCRCLPNETYYVKSFAGSVATLYVCFYDANKTLIDRLQGNNQTLVAPTNACFFRISCYGYGTTYNNDICINLSDPSRNGIYVPYRRYVELNGINDAIDTVTVEKNVTLPFGLVDLGDLNWNKHSTYNYFYATLSGAKGTSLGAIANGVLSKYYTLVESWGGNITGNLDARIFQEPNKVAELRIRNDNFSDAATFKTAMKGVYLYYELEDYPLNGTPILAGSYVRKIEKVDLGTLGWTFDTTSYTVPVFYATVSGKTAGNVLCYKYTNKTGTSWGALSNGEVNGGYLNFVAICDTTYDNAATFKTAMSGVYLYYELATPVETTLTAQQCAEILNGAFTKSKYSTLLTDNDNGQIDQTVDVGMWEQK